MPIFNYKCLNPDCGKVDERLIMGEDDLREFDPCPQCGYREMERTIEGQTFAARTGSKTGRSGGEMHPLDGSFPSPDGIYLAEGISPSGNLEIESGVVTGNRVVRSFTVEIKHVGSEATPYSGSRDKSKMN